MAWEALHPRGTRRFYRSIGYWTKLPARVKGPARASKNARNRDTVASLSG
jgi:hypothetical protein